MNSSPERIIGLDLPSEILWMFLAVGLIFFLVMSFVLQHHWKYYGIRQNPKVFAKSLFWIISIVLILIMFFSIIIFENI